MNEHLKKAAIGWTSNATAMVVCSPLEVIRSQAQITGRSTSVKSLISDIYKTQSIKGFYRGLGASVITQPSFWMIYMPTYSYLKNEYPDTSKFVTSSVAGAIGSVFTNPLWVLRTRLQTEAIRGDTNKYSSFFQNAIRKEGVTSLWKGWGIALVKNLQMGIQLPLYEALREKEYNPLVSGAIAKFAASSLVYPLDVIRTNVRATVGHISFGNAVRQIYNRKGGFINFYRGMPLYLMAQLPIFGVTMLVFENLH